VLVDAWYLAVCAGGVFIAISIAFPIFLIHRKSMQARRDGSASAGVLSATDLLSLALLAVAMPVYTFVSLAR
jgi:Kef-type K+ transport system membrane component KefB